MADESIGFRYGIAFILQVEGGFVQDLGDGAGATNRGLTSRSYPDLDIPNLTEAETVAIYARDYWQAIQLDAFEVPLAVAMFDCAVNSGTATAIRLLQGVLGVSPDGVVGPQTIAAAQAQRGRVLERYLVARALRYADNKNFGKFGRAWMTRLLRCARYCDSLP